MSRQPCVGFLQKNGCGDCVCNRSARTALGAGVGPPLRSKQACGWKVADTIRGFRAVLSSAIKTHELIFFKENKTNMQEDFKKILLSPI